MSYFLLNSNRILHRRLLFLVVRTYRQMSTSRSSSGQLHSYISLQLIWLCFINSPSSWSALAGASLQIFLNSSTLAASLYTCFARWYNLKVETTQKESCIIIHYKRNIQKHNRIVGFLAIHPLYENSLKKSKLSKSLLQKFTYIFFKSPNKKIMFRVYQKAMHTSFFILTTSCTCCVYFLCH